MSQSIEFSSVTISKDTVELAISKDKIRLLSIGTSDIFFFFSNHVFEGLSWAYVQ